MNVASLENCKELYELSGWDDTAFVHNTLYVKPQYRYNGDFQNIGELASDVPAYDLGYLLRKLDGFDIKVFYVNQWRQWYCFADDDKPELQAHADTPEDAACKLAIELFK